MQNNLLLGYFNKIFRIDLPYRDSLDEYIDYILPKIKSLSQNLQQDDLFQEGRYWLEIRDTDEAHETLLHSFSPTESPEPTPDGGQANTYLYAVDGYISKGSWARMGSKTLFINGLKHEMYDLQFLNINFMILKKHGNHKGAKYLFLADENLISQQYDWYDALGRRRDQVQLEWRDVVELLFDIYRYNVFFVASAIGIVLFLILLGLLST